MLRCSQCLLVGAEPSRVGGEEEEVMTTANVGILQCVQNDGLYLYG
jgi:hypothetical protein